MPDLERDSLWNPGTAGGATVLIVAKVIGSAAGGYADYLEGKTQAPGLGDYYLKDGERVEAPGRWASGARTVGCDPDVPVTGEELRELMAVRRPDTNMPLRRAGGSGEAVAAIDATFSAPKSVSAVWAVGDPDLRAHIERAHELAIDRALGYALEHVKMIRQRVDAGTVIHGKATGLVATSWRHTTARAVEGQAPDPQLHSHVLLHGAVRRDGRIVALDSRSWLVHQREIGAAYRTELAREIRELGFEIQRATGRGGRYFEIDGVPPELLDRWSSRHHQVHEAIRQRLAEHETELAALIAAGGPAGADAAHRLELLRDTLQLAPKEERFMSTATRSRKAPVTVADLDSTWERTARTHGLTAEDLPVLRSRRLPLTPAPAHVVLDGLTEFDATFPARDARAVALERSAGTPIADALAALKQLREVEEIVVLADRTGTTREHRAREHATVAVAERLAADTTPPLPTNLVDAEINRLDNELAEDGGRLSTEQRDAIELACGEQRLVVIEGQAGTGKSTTLTGICRAHHAAGQEIIVTSTAALAAERLAQELEQARVPVSAYSTIALQNAIATGRVELTARSTVIHDEAALASTREQQQILGAAERSGARLIEVGDPQQNQPVGAGGLWSHLDHTTRQYAAHIELSINQRARDPTDRRDQKRFRDSQHELAIRGYAARDRIHFETDQRRAEDRGLDAAQADRQAGKRTIVIAQTSNEHLDELNARAQAIRHQHGELGIEALRLPGRPYHLHPGDEIQIRRNLTHPEHGRLRNGTSATVTAIGRDEQTITLRLADKREVELTPDQTVQADLRLAYVQHPFPAQGQTTDTAHLIVGEHATKEGTYVAITRAREATHLHAGHDPDDGDGDRLQHLADRLGRTEPDVPSIDLRLLHGHAISRTPDQPDRTIPAAEMRAPTEPDLPAPPYGPVPTQAPRTSSDPHHAPEPDPAHDAREPVGHTPDRERDQGGHGGRRWPTRARRSESRNRELEPENDQTPRWEP